MRTGAALRRLAGVLLLAGGAAAPAEHLVAEVSAPKERVARRLEDDVFVENIACGETRHESTANAAHWLSGNDAPDHFYVITPAETAYYHFSTCGSDYDTMLYLYDVCLLYTSPSPRDGLLSRMPSSA